METSVLEMGMRWYIRNEHRISLSCCIFIKIYEQTNIRNKYDYMNISNECEYEYEYEYI